MSYESLLLSLSDLLGPCSSFYVSLCVRYSLENENILAAPTGTLSINFLWHSGSVGYVNCVVPQEKHTWPLGFIDVYCEQCSEAHSNKATCCIRKMKSWKGKQNDIFKNTRFIAEDLQCLMSLLTCSSSGSIWLSEQSFKLLQRGQSLGPCSRTSALVCVVHCQHMKQIRSRNDFYWEVETKTLSACLKIVGKTLLEVWNKKGTGHYLL